MRKTKMNAVYLQAILTPPGRKRDAAGRESFTALPGVTATCTLLFDEKGVQEPSISGLARRFCRHLKKQGHTAGTCAK